MRLKLPVALLLTGVVFFFPSASAQPKSAQSLASVDLTGYWVSVVTEDWRFRMVTPDKGDYASIPIGPEGKRIADGWDPARDEAAGEQCKAYGAPAIMRVPGRFHITWESENTLRMESDAGRQTRLFYFGAQPQSEASLQGSSHAEWEFSGAGPAAQGAGPQPARDTRGGSLRVVTSHLKPGYLRRNGVPYGADVKLTEYFSRVDEPTGDSWLIVTTIVEDPEYLTQPFVTSAHFKRQADNAGWNPSPCKAK